MNYKKVIEDFNNGTIDPKEWRLTMDNDGGYWCWLSDAHNLSDEDFDDLSEVKCQEMDDKYGKPEGYNDIVDVLVAAGVTCEWC